MTRRAPRIPAPDLPDHDEDQNPLGVPDPKSDVGQLLYLLHAARFSGFELRGTIQVGGVVVQNVRDLRQVEARRDPDAPDPGWERAHGHNPDG